MGVHQKPSNSGPLIRASQDAVGIRRRLRAWFARHKRDLPWRRSRDPYAIWLSEMMLQQTQVVTVIPYYNRFIGRFPTVTALARADLEEVLRYWAGLGYYARARNMHRAARLIVAEHGGAFPSDAAALRRLPGIGAYTAGAVASMAFDERAAVVDGNVARVLARLFEVDLDIGDGRGKALLWEIAERLLPRKDCGDFNQALMELGATVCLPRGAARCEACPLETFCGARRSGSVERLPVKARQAAPRSESHVVAAIQRHGKWLAVRRPSRGLWGGLWELPTAVMNGSADSAAARDLIKGLISGDGHIATKPFCRIQHQLTHRTITLVGHVCHVAAPRRVGRRAKKRVRGHHRQPDRETRWLSLEEINKLGLSAAMRKVVGALELSLAREAGTTDS
jgi:A/G-specific adenine glycosylase